MFPDGFVAWPFVRYASYLFLVVCSTLDIVAMVLMTIFMFYKLVYFVESYEEVMAESRKKYQ